MKTHTAVVTSHQLDKANLVINQFITSCSHSMRGPLKTIRGLVNLLKGWDTENGTDPEQVINYIEGNADKMENMLDELEQFMVNSQVAPRSQHIDLEDLLQDVLTIYQREITRDEISISIKVTQSGLFYSDSGRIRMVASHLLMNAITFQRENVAKRIAVTCEEEGNQCIITVTDNGMGVDPEHYENIFKLFYQAAPNSHGAGIGLFVVKEAVDKLGGKVTVKSTPGLGSTFRVVIPNYF